MPAKVAYVELSGRFGQYFNGTRSNLEGVINYRMQTFGIPGFEFQLQPCSTGGALCRCQLHSFWSQN